MSVCGKNKEVCERDIPLTTNIVSKIPSLGMCKIEFQTWCSNFTMIQWLSSSKSMFYWDKFGCVKKKDRVSRQKEGKTKLRRRESIKTHRLCENRLNISLFITRVLRAYCLLCFYLFYHFIKIFILLPFKWINKISFLFYFKSLFN